jgi:AcrR family transcriptional regulator
LRQQILHAARDIMVKEGYGALSMRKVADRIEYSPTAIYLHFADKQSLLVELCEETFAKPLGILRQIVADCVRLKKVKAVDVDITTRALWAGVHGITSLLIVYENFPWGDRDTVIKTLVEPLVAGLRPGRKKN